MSTQLSVKSSQERNHHAQRITPNGTLFEFLVPPDKAKHEVCLIRCTIPPGAAVPLHSHADVEIFYVLEGAVEAFQSSDGSPRWMTIRVGDTATIPGNTKHALRNSSPLPTRMVVVTTSKLYEFFQQVTKPFDPNRSATPPTAAEIQGFFRVVSKYGYWMGSPEENAAIGLNIG